MDSLGIVILNYNDCENTKMLSKRLLMYLSIDFIVVVDNASKDNSYEVLRELECDRLTVIRSDSNKGYSAGNNIGIRYLNEKGISIIGIANTDVKFDENLIKQIKVDFALHPECAIVTGVQFDNNCHVASHPFWYEYTPFKWYHMKLNTFYLVNKLRRKSYLQGYISSKLSEGNFFYVGAVEGSLFFIRMEDIVASDYLDEHIFLYCEEDVLSKKLALRNRKIGVDKTVSYIHYGASTTKKSLSSVEKKKIECRSGIYCFNTYISGNRFYQLINLIICWLVVLETAVGFIIKKFMDYKG